MKYQNLTVIGTSHIAKQSINEIIKTFEKLRPDIIALELDKKRLISLLTKKKTKQQFSIKRVFQIGVKGYIFSLLGEWVEKKLGDSIGVKPGSDMLTAFKLAKEGKKKVALIDQDIEITLKKLSKAISWKEKGVFVADLFRAFVLRKKEIEGFDLRTVPPKDLMKKMMNKVKKKYPNIYRVLVSERNKIMAKNLLILMKKEPDKKILAIIGAGHEKEMIELIKKKKNSIEVIPLNITSSTGNYSINYLNTHS